MEPINRIKSSGNWIFLDLDFKEYFIKQLKYLSLCGKGLGIDQNVHVYSNCEDGKVNSNLICHLELVRKNRIMLRECNSNGIITKADKYPDLIKLLNIPTNGNINKIFKHYDLSKHKDLLEFDNLIEKISRI